VYTILVRKYEEKGLFRVPDLDNKKTLKFILSNIRNWIHPAQDKVVRNVWKLTQILEYMLYEQRAW
jgi:hypothetical protein